MSMKKDIKWFVDKWTKERDKTDVHDPMYHFINEFIADVNQLDDPEVLTQEWIDKYSYNIEEYWEVADMMDKPQYAVSVENLQNLLVPKQEITYEDAIKVIAENIDTDEFSVGMYIEALNNNEKYEFLTDKWIEDNTSPVDDEGRLSVWKRDLQNVIVPKQELPVVIPKYVADWIEEMKQDERPLYSAMSSLMNKTNREWANWKRTNKNFSEIVAQAWLDGYEVEEEPLYYALIKGHELIDSDKVYWIYDKNNDEVFISSLHSSDDNFLEEMSKEDWNKHGINDSNADFIKEDEVAE